MEDKIDSLWAEMLVEFKRGYKSHIKDLQQQVDTLNNTVSELKVNHNNEIRKIRQERDNIRQERDDIKQKYSALVEQSKAISNNNTNLMQENQQLKQYIKEHINPYFNNNTDIQAKANKKKAENKQKRAESIKKTIEWLYNEGKCEIKNGVYIFDVQEIRYWLGQYYKTSAEYNTIRGVAQEEWGGSIGFKNTVGK